MQLKDRLDQPWGHSPTVDPEEIARFDALADEWWNPQGKFRMVHAFNEVRCDFIVDRVARHFHRNKQSGGCLSGLDMLDVGCGAGLVSERLAEVEANVVGIDATAREDRFRSMLGDALAAKAASQWSPIVSSEEVFSPSEWMVGTATMNKLIAPIAEGIPVQRQMKVTSITRDGSDWRLGFDPGDDRQTFDAVVCTIPAPQVRPLFEGEAALLADIDGVRMAPCWALMLTFETPLDPGFDVWRSDRHNLAWFCRNASRPERNTSHESWVLHADAEWSERHLEASPEFIAAELIERLANALPLRLPAIERVMAHRWRYARTTVALGRPFLATKDQTLLFGGDWTLGARVECAYESGLAMADAVAEKLGV